MKLNRDREQVEAWMRKRKVSRAQLARKLGSSRALVTQYLEGDREISDRYVHQLSVLTEIEPQTFYRCRAARKLGQEAA